MKKPELALQMGMVKRHLAENGVFQTFLYTAQSGIKNVSLPFCPLDKTAVEKIAKAAETAGVFVIAVEVGYGKEGTLLHAADIKEKKEQIIEAAKGLGAEYIRIAKMPQDFLAGPEAIREICKEWDDLAGCMEPRGLKLAYRCHNEEFEKIQGRFILDYILEYSEKIIVELDTFWVHMGGQFAADWIEKTKGRNDLLDVQDILVRAPKGIQLVRSLLLDDSVRPSEVAQGNLDFEKITEAACKGGVKYICINQEKTYGHTPFESVGHSVMQLNHLLENR